MAILTVRPALYTDIPAVVAINATGRPGVYPLTPETVVEVLASASYVMVADLDGQVVGYVIGYTTNDVCEGDEFAWFQAHIPQFLYIDQIAVMPTARRLHVGAQLYAHATFHACTHDIPALVCEVNLDPPNPASLCFHRRLGFLEVEMMTVQDGRTVLLYQKELSESDCRFKHEQRSLRDRSVSACTLRW